MTQEKKDQPATDLLPCPFCGGKAHPFENMVYCRGKGKEGCGASHLHNTWNRRADLAAPSAPAEVEGLVERLRDEHLAMTREEAATALITQEAEIAALQAENAKMRKADEILQGLYEIEKARAEKAEAERDELISVISDEISRSRRHLSAATLAAYAKLKGDV